MPRPNQEKTVNLQVSNTKKTLLALAALLALTAALYAPVAGYGFVYDDRELVLQNPRLMSWDQAPGYFTSDFFSHHAGVRIGYYRPVTLLWMRAVYAVAGPPQPLWHVAGILLHLATVAALYILLLRITMDWRAALAAAGLFALHPLQAETVAWVSAQGDLLATLFTILALYFAIARKGSVSYASLAFAMLAAFSKEAGVLAPAAILAYELTRARGKDAVRAVLPYLLPMLLYAALRENALHGVNLRPAGSYAAMSTLTMVLTWPRVLAAYAAHLLLPWKLGLSYDVFPAQAWWPLAVLLALAAAAVWWLRGSSGQVRFGAAWLALCLLPALAIRNMTPALDFVHDRYAYLPMAALAVLAASWLANAQRWRWQAAGTVLVLMALGMLTYRTLPHWRNEIAAYSQAVQTAPHNSTMWNNLGGAYWEAHDMNSAIPCFEQAIAVGARDALPYLNLAHYYDANGDSEKAAEYRQAARQMQHRAPRY